MDIYSVLALDFSKIFYCNLLVLGFDQPTVMITNCSLPFMAELILENGYDKKMDFVQYKIKTPIVMTNETDWKFK